MRVILYVATTVNGLIAKKDGKTGFTSDEDWEWFYKTAKDCGNIIMGRKTYETMLPNLFPVKDLFNVVLTHQKIENKYGDQVVFTDKSPQEVLKMLEERHFWKAFVAGGSQIYTEFMEQGLVDEIYIDMEPLVFGKGIPLFQPTDFEYKLELLEIKQISRFTIQLHYRVLK